MVGIETFGAKQGCKLGWALPCSLSEASFLKPTLLLSLVTTESQKHSSVSYSSNPWDFKCLSYSWLRALASHAFARR